MGIERFVRVINPDLRTVDEALAWAASKMLGEFRDMRDVQIVIEQRGPDAWHVLISGNEDQDTTPQ